LTWRPKDRRICTFEDSQGYTPVAELGILPLQHTAALSQHRELPRDRGVLVLEGAYLRAQGHLAGGALGPGHLVFPEPRHLRRGRTEETDPTERREREEGR